MSEIIHLNKTYTINNMVWTIREVDRLDQNLYMEYDEEFHFGVCNLKENIVFFDGTQSKERLINTLTHEMAHVFMCAYGFLQVDFNDEIVADFIASYGKSISNIVEDYIEEREKCYEIYEREI